MGGVKGTAAELKAEVLWVAQESLRTNLVHGTAGNFSARLPDGNVVLTPSSVAYETMTLDDLVVTDLDGSLVERALASLNAELSRREAVLAQVGAKDIDDHRRLVGAPGGPREVLPRLVIVVDEFASLVEELPDFVGDCRRDLEATRARADHGHTLAGEVEVVVPSRGVE